MKNIVLITLIISVCFGCTNSNVYSRGETPDWYLEPAVECSSHESKVCEELGATLACECVA